MPEGIPGASVNEKAVEEIKDYDNPTIQELLESSEVIQPDDEITADDYEATRSRATVLARESKAPASTEALLLAAFMDRKKLVEGLGDEAIRNLPDEALRSVVYVDTGHKLTDEEIHMFRKSSLGLEEWTQERFAAKRETSDGYVAVNEEDAVIARGHTSPEAMRRAQDESGREI